MNNHQKKILLLLLISVAGIIAAFLFPRIPQNSCYHHFADERNLFGIPHFWNVISNLPFVVTGILGAGAIALNKPQGMFPMLKAAYFLFYAGIILTGIGSAYYHLNPTTTTLLWDRLPMTIAFMAFFAVMTGEFISMGFAKKALPVLILMGVSSVLYWYFTEMNKAGDLRFYALVQFLPMLLIPLMLLLFKKKTNTSLYTWLVLLAYLIAKICETYDYQLFEMLNQVSGHTLKHFAASLAPLVFLMGLYKRKTGF